MAILFVASYLLDEEKLPFCFRNHTLEVAKFLCSDVTACENSTVEAVDVLMRDIQQ